MIWRPRGKHLRLPVGVTYFDLVADDGNGNHCFARWSPSGHPITAGSYALSTIAQGGLRYAYADARLTNGATVGVEFPNEAGETLGYFSLKGSRSKLDPDSVAVLIDAVKNADSLPQAAARFFDVVQGLPDTSRVPALLIPSKSCLALLLEHVKNKLNSGDTVPPHATLAAAQRTMAAAAKSVAAYAATLDKTRGSGPTTDRQESHLNSTKGIHASIRPLAWYVN
ncbi:MAG: hypothetical protein ACRDTD_30520 [Pseudonocardiaceae bacterium]